MMLQVQIHTQNPNWYFVIQRKGGQLNVIMHRDMFDFSLIVDENDFREAVNTLCLLEEDANV